jgi:predicted nucleic acid-binding protein
MTFVADSSAWIDYLNGHSDFGSRYLASALVRNDVLLLDAVATKVLQGLRIDERFASVLRLFAELPFDTVGGFGRAAASAANFRFLRSRGITLRSLTDCQIATYCLEHDLQLLHNDRDFDAFEAHLGLRVVPRRTVAAT